MRHIRSPARNPGAIDPSELAAACDDALAAAAAASGARAALDAALNALYRRVPGLFASVLVPEHNHLWIVSSRGYAALPDGIAIREGVVGRAVHSGEAQLVLDVAADPDFVATVRGIASELALPLEDRRGRLIGVLDIETSRRLPPDSVRTLRPLADTVADHLAHAEIERDLDLSALARLFVFVGSLREPEAIADIAARSLPRIVALDVCQVVLGDGPSAWDASTWRSPGTAIEPLSPSAVAALRDRIDGAAVVETLDVTGMRLPELAGTGVRSALLVPLRVGGFDLGTLVGVSDAPVAIDQSQSDVIALLAAHAATSIDASVTLTHERLAALTDPLTGLLNRRGFEPRLEDMLEESELNVRPLSLIVLDCDDFKTLNDRAGHEQGDVLLCELASLLRRSLPLGAETGRLGGDEFVAVLPDTGPDAALAAASGLVSTLTAGLDEAGFPLGVSLGVATFPEDGAGVTHLMRAADQALYEAKAAGKSRAVAFRDVLRRDRNGTPPAADQRAEGSHARELRSLTEAATALWAETSAEELLDRLARSLTFLLGGTGCVVSVVDGQRLVEVVRHSLRDVDLGEDMAYLLADFPVTREVLGDGEPRAISLLDDDLDAAEDLVLRDLGMSCCMLVPIVVGDTVWGIAEIYEMRMRRFTTDEIAAAAFLVAQAARRLQDLGGYRPRARIVPTFRLPGA
jgi:diguanylate cyclase (GGDEF)-like protein